MAKNDLLLYRQANNLLVNNKLDDALSLYIKIDNKTPQVLFNIAQIYLKKAKYEQAKPILERLRRAEDWSEIAYYYLGFIALKEEKQEQAIEFFETVINNTHDEKIKQKATRIISSINEGASIKGGDTITKNIKSNIRIAWVNDSIDSQFTETEQISNQRDAGELELAVGYQNEQHSTSFVALKRLSQQTDDELSYVSSSYRYLGWSKWELGAALANIESDLVSYKQVQSNLSYRVSQMFAAHAGINHYVADSLFSYLDGQRYQVMFDASTRLLNQSLFVRYKLYQDDRVDYSEESNISYSPLVQNVSFYYSFFHRQAISSDLHLWYEHKQWPVDDISDNREVDFSGLELSLTYQFHQYLDIYGKIGYQDWRETADVVTKDRVTTVELGMYLNLH